MRQLPKRTKIYGGGHFWDLQDEEGREVIYEWSQERRLNLSTKTTLYYRGFLVYTFTLGTLKSFFQNFNFMVLVQMVIAAISVYLSKYFNLTFNVNVGLFVSPIVFPLAFSINTDFQRREKVLDDLANFKSAGLSWFFCMRDWREAAHLDILWMQAVHQKLKSMLFYMREYLLTNKTSHRKVILRAMYEDFSDTNQLIENLRVSDLPANSALVSRSLVLLTSLCLAFERLRVIREYRSPRSIRSFNKVLIFVLPILLSPYFVYEGQKSKNDWSPYYISVLVAFVFSALQGVQDKLDDPFDGMSEDDINLSTIDEWTFESLEATANRTFTIGRFQVQTQVNAGGSKEVIFPRSSFSSSIDHIDKSMVLSRKLSTRFVSFSGEQKQHKSSSYERPAFRHSVSRKSTIRKQSERSESLIDSFNLESHPFASILDKIQGDTKIFPGGVTRPVDDNYHHSLNSIGEDSENQEDQTPLPISDDSTNTPGTSFKESHSISTDAFESPTVPSKLRLNLPKKPKFGFKLRKVTRGNSNERIRFLKPDKESSTHSENFVVIDTMKDSKSNSDLDDSVFDDISV